MCIFKKMKLISSAVVQQLVLRDILIGNTQPANERLFNGYVLISSYLLYLFSFQVLDKSFIA